MGKPTVQQIAGLNIVDWLYFNQTLIHVVVDQDVLAWFTEISQRVKTEVAATGAAGMDAEIMKHYVLCFLEILGSDEPDSLKVGGLLKYHKNFFCAMLVVISESARNDSLSEALSIAEALLDYVLLAPAIVRVRLAERCLAAEYITAAHEGFMWLVRTEAIPCAKFREAVVCENPSYRAVVARIGLLCEFEWARFYFCKSQKNIGLARLKFEFIANTLSMDQKKMIKEAEDLWMEKNFGEVSKSFTIGFDISRQSDKDYVWGYLKSVNSHWSRKRFFLGTSAGWVSNFGALSIMISKSTGDRRPIYIEVNKKNAGTLAEDAKNTMLHYGMTIHARSLYMRYHELTMTMLPRIRYYCQVIKTGPGVFFAEEEDPFYRVVLVIPCHAEDMKGAPNVELKTGDNYEQQNKNVMSNSATTSVISDADFWAGL